MPRLKVTNLPTRPAAMALIQYYIDSVYSLFPAFPETSLFHALDAVYQSGGRPVADFEYWLMYMVLAIGSVSRSRSKNDSYYKDGVMWVAHALKYADDVLAPGYITQMQALILLVQYSMLDPTHFDSWQLIGFACRALVDLGFHQDPPKEQQGDKAALDLRRKIFYCLYSLDRSTHLPGSCLYPADMLQVHQHGTCPTVLVYGRCYKCRISDNSWHCPTGSIQNYTARTPVTSVCCAPLSASTDSVKLVPRLVPIES